MAPPWDIYAKELFHHGYSYPLWTPDPAPGAPEVMIGDVGWLDEGAFHTLFNTLKEAGEPQPRGHVPVDYVPFERSKAVIDGPREKIAQSALFGRAIHDVSAEASVSTGGITSTPSMGLSLRFQCTDDYGAVLLLDPSGVSHAIKSHGLISRYMRQHFEKWLELANGRFELGLKDEELIFICGTVKTSRWGVAAFHGDYREKFGSITGNMSSFASVEFSLHVADAKLQSAYYRAGPPKYRLGRTRPMAIGEQGSAAETVQDQDKADQCIFVHYYKMKRRMFLLHFPMRAAAGPRDLFEDEDDDDNPSGGLWWESAMMVDEEDDLEEGHHLLDYILQYSEAQYALASDLDAKKLLESSDKGPPADIFSTLVELRPSIDIDEYGVGTIAHGTIPFTPSEVSLSGCSSLSTTSSHSDMVTLCGSSTTGGVGAAAESRETLYATHSYTKEYGSPVELKEHRSREGHQTFRRRIDPVYDSISKVLWPYIVRPPSSEAPPVHPGLPSSTRRLNNYLQEHGMATSLSWEDKVIGPRHATEWTSVVKIDGKSVATGIGPQKSLARDAAAKEALAILTASGTIEGGSDSDIISG